MFSTKSRIIAVMSVVMALVLSIGGLAAPKVTDVAKDHWAYEAVMSLVEKGYLGVYEDGSFKGDEPVSRYLLAFVVTKMLTDLEKGTTSATEEDMGVLREVANELRGEIVPLLAALETSVSSLETTGVENQKSLTAERQERKAEAAGILDDLDEQAIRLKSIDEAITRTNKNIALLEVALADEAIVKGKLIDALKKYDETSSAEAALALKGISSSQVKTDASISALESELKTLISALDAKQSKSLADGIAALKKAASEEATAERQLIDAIKLEGENGRAKLASSQDALQKSQADIDARVGLLSREIAALKAALGQDIQKAISDLSSYLEGESGSRKELEAKLYALEAKQAKDLAVGLEERKAEAAGILNDLKEQAARLKSIDEAMLKTNKALALLEVALADEAVAKGKLIEALKNDDAAHKTESALSYKELKGLQEKTDASITALETELETLKTVLGEEIDKSVDQLSAYLESEMESRKALEERLALLEDESMESLAAAMSAIKEWAGGEHGKLSVELSARISELEAKQGKSLADEIAALKKAASDEAAAERRLMEAMTLEGEAGRAKLAASQDELKKAQAETASKIELLNREMASVKAALGQDIQKAITDLSAYLENESGSRKELEGKLLALEAKQAKELANGLDEIKAKMAQESADNDKALATAIESLNGYIGQEARARAQADEAASAKLVELDNVLGADIEKAISGMQLALGQEKSDRIASNEALKQLLSAENAAANQNALKILDAEKLTRADSDAKLSAEITKLRNTMVLEDNDIRSMVVRNTIELQDKDTELALSIADLRVAMDTANVGITNLKDRVSSVETRLYKLETSVDVLKSNLDSTTKLLISVNDDLSRVKAKQETLEARLADMQVKTDAKIKKLEGDSIDQMTDLTMQAQERETKLSTKVDTLEKQLADQNEQLQAELKKMKGLGITGLVIGILGLVIGIVAIFLPTAP